METRVNDNNKQVSKSLQRTWTQKLTDTNQQHYKPHSVSKVLTFNQNKNHASSPKVLFTRVLLQKKTDTVSQSKKLALNISTGWHCCNQLPLSCRHYQLALFQSHSLQTYTECTQACIVINQMIRLKVLTTIVRTPRKWHLKALRCNSFRYLDRIFIFAATSCKQFFIPKWTSLKDASKGHKNSYQCMGLVLAGAAEGCNLDLKYPSKYYKNKPQNHNAHTTTVLQLPLLQSLWHYYNHYDTITLEALCDYALYKSTFTLHLHYITITMTLLQSLWHCYNHYDTTTITMTLLQSLWHCYNHCDTITITMTLLQSLWHCYNHCDTITITMTLLQSLCPARLHCSLFIYLFILWMKTQKVVDSFEQRYWGLTAFRLCLCWAPQPSIGGEGIKYGIPIQFELQQLNLTHLYIIYGSGFAQMHPPDRNWKISGFIYHVYLGIPVGLLSHCRRYVFSRVLFWFWQSMHISSSSR